MISFSFAARLKSFTSCFWHQGHILSIPGLGHPKAFCLYLEKVILFSCAFKNNGFTLIIFFLLMLNAI